MDWDGIHLLSYSCGTGRDDRTWTVIWPRIRLTGQSYRRRRLGSIDLGACCYQSTPVLCGSGQIISRSLKGRRRRGGGCERTFFFYRWEIESNFSVFVTILLLFNELGKLLLMAYWIRVGGEQEQDGKQDAMIMIIIIIKSTVNAILEMTSKFRRFIWPGN